MQALNSPMRSEKKFVPCNTSSVNLTTQIFANGGKFVLYSLNRCHEKVRGGSSDLDSSLISTGCWAGGRWWRPAIRGHTWAQHGSQGHTSTNLVSRGLTDSTEKQWDANRTMGPIPRSLLPVPPSGNVCSLDIKCIPQAVLKGPVRNIFVSFQ